MDKRTNYLSLILLDALEDENESDINFILDRNIKAIDASYVPQDRGIAPLHYVCGMRNEQLAIDIARRFLEMGADPNCRSEDNMTPLHVAAMYGREEIVNLLLQYGADLEVYDDDRKTPVLYAIDECNFEVVQIMRDHIFLKKYEKKKEYLSAMTTEYSCDSTLQKVLSRRAQFKSNKNDDLQAAKNNKLLRLTNISDDCFANGKDNKLTPNRMNYNYDVTSPYYINITHRRDKPQPKFPEYLPDDTERNSKPENTNLAENMLSISMQEGNLSSPEPVEVNIFSLTKENIKELTLRNDSCERSRLSLIEIWREKVQKSRARQSIVKQFNDIVELVDQVIENDHLNFTNTELKENSNIKESNQPDIEIDSRTCDLPSSSLTDTTDNFDEIPAATESTKRKHKKKPQLSLSQLMQTVAEAKLQNFELDHLKISKTNSLEQNRDLESSYQTVPEMCAPYSSDDKEMQTLNTTCNFIRSPKNNEYFLQMTEAYVHTDDENGLVFYETKLLSNIGNKQTVQRNHCTSKNSGQDLHTTMTSQSTNITLPLDYETDTLRAELTAFGEPPGPITKTTKKLYIKRLIKYKRNITNILDLPKNQNRKENID